MGSASLSGRLELRTDWAQGRCVIRAGILSEDWRMKRVPRDGVDVTDTPLDFSSDIDNLGIEFFSRWSSI
jgi:hypothetical protein